MDVRWLLGLVGAFMVWAYQAKITFILFGHLFVIPVLILVATLLALVLLALIAVIIRSFLDGGLILGRG